MNGKIGLKNAHKITCKRIYIHFILCYGFHQGRKGSGYRVGPNPDQDIIRYVADNEPDLAVKPYLCDVIFTPVSAEFGACRARLEHHLAERFGA